MLFSGKTKGSDPNSNNEEHDTQVIIERSLPRRMEGSMEKLLSRGTRYCFRTILPSCERKRVKINMSRSMTAIIQYDNNMNIFLNSYD